ncbi:MAG: hypothetical protein NVSMB4_02350 [Acidimicrobiales bacterium]
MATADFFGTTLRLNSEGVSEFALMEFATAANEGQDGDTSQGMASLYRLVVDCVHPEDVGKFKATARKNRAKAADLMPLVEATFAAVAERPTGQPADSTDGLPPVSTEASSESKHAAKDSLEEVLPGRPDLQLAVLRAREAV